MPSVDDRALARMLREPQVVMPQLAQWLDDLDDASRIRAIRQLGPKEQRALWHAAEGFKPLELTHLVPAEVSAGTTVRHFGKNTLPMFSHFEKRFCRPQNESPAHPAQLYGYNHQSTSFLTGPGYFVVTTAPTHGELLVDYHRIPHEVPAGWPALRSNESGVTRLVYGFMQDVLRRVSRHVSIGSATRHGKPLDSWFVLARQDA